jgi:subtilisin family serine protease
MCRDSSFARLRLLVLLIPIFVVGMLFVPAPGYSKSRGRGYRSGDVKYLNPALGSGKVSPLVRAVREELKARGITRENARSRDASALSNNLVRVDADGNIQSYIRVHTFGTDKKSQLEAYGAEIERVNTDVGVIRARIPFTTLEEVAQLSFVKLITPPDYAVTRIGSVTTEGDAVLNADQLRALGFDGTGVRVGVISDGVNSMATAQGLGDLPAVTIQTHAGNGDEGTAMLEIVHDLAPGAVLGFCGPADSLEMVDCVNDLANVFNADIIVDDLGFYSQAFFEDDYVAQAVENAVSNGVFYTSSAGNDALAHYQGDYVNSGDGTHLIGPGNIVFEVTGSSVTVVLQWSNRFDGTASDDYDLCLATEDPAACGTSNFTQDGAGLDDWPIEARQEDCSGVCEFQVRLINGSAQTLELFVLGADLDNADDRVAADSIFGHPAVPGAMAAAAVRYDLDTIEPFSSRGPATILFPGAAIRQKPDLTATDGVTVTGVGGFPSPFFGTSASSPHVAGVAALLMSGGRTASAASFALRQTASDLGPVGRDTTYGYGRINALAANAFLEGLIQFSLRVDDDGGGGSDNFCFIAAAAHGSPIVLQVEALRKFLDGFLGINRASRQR